MMEYSGHNFQQLGFTELVTADLLSQCAEGNYGWYYVQHYLYICGDNLMDVSMLGLVRALTRASSGLPFELVSHCVVVPSEDASFNAHEDATEEEFQSRLDSV